MGNRPGRADGARPGLPSGAVREKASSSRHFPGAASLYSVRRPVTGRRRCGAIRPRRQAATVDRPGARKTRRRKAEGDAAAFRPRARGAAQAHCAREPAQRGSRAPPGRLCAARGPRQRRPHPSRADPWSPGRGAPSRGGDGSARCGTPPRLRRRCSPAGRGATPRRRGGSSVRREVQAVVRRQRPSSGQRGRPVSPFRLGPGGAGPLLARRTGRPTRHRGGAAVRHGSPRPGGRREEEPTRLGPCGPGRSALQSTAGTGRPVAPPIPLCEDPHPDASDG